MNFQSIESRENTRLKHARKVRDGRSKGQVLVEGPKLALEAISSGLLVHECFIQRDAVGHNNQIDHVLNTLTSSGVPVAMTSENLLASISDTVMPQGIVLVCDRPNDDFERFEAQMDRIKPTIPIIVGLFGVNDPANLGATMRTAEAAGARGLVTTAGSTNAFAPKSLRASAGSAFRFPIWAGAEALTVIEWAKRRGMAITATTAAGARLYTDIDLNRERLLILGSEAHGLDQEVLELADESLRIEICKPVESLNLGVTAGIILFEAKRQIRSAKLR